MTSEEPDLLKFALDQFAGESASLLAKDDNLYIHITALDPANTWDTRIWATGNGWMTYGLTRVVSAFPTLTVQAGLAIRADVSSLLSNRPIRTKTFPVR